MGVNPGDQFVTTGFDRSFFPGGVAVGRAIETRDASTPLEQQVVLEPTAQLDRLSFVTVLLFEPVS